MKFKKRNIKEILEICQPDPPEEETRKAQERVWERLSEELKKHDTSLRSLTGDGWNAPALEQREFQVLTAVSMVAGKGRLGDVTRRVQTWVDLSWGRVWVTVHNLERRKLIVPAERGWQLTDDGERALRRAKIEEKQLVEARAEVKDGLTEESR